MYLQNIMETFASSKTNILILQLQMICMCVCASSDSGIMQSIKGVKGWQLDVLSP